MTIPMAQRSLLVDHQAEGRASTARVRDAFQNSDLGLTQRECEVAHLMARGLTAYSIGRALGISERTVHKHLQNAYRKLGVNDRLSAVRTLESVNPSR